MKISYVVIPTGAATSFLTTKELSKCMRVVTSPEPAQHTEVMLDMAQVFHKLYGEKHGFTYRSVGTSIVFFRGKTNVRMLTIRCYEIEVV